MKLFSIINVEQRYEIIIWMKINYVINLLRVAVQKEITIMTDFSKVLVTL